MIIITLDTAFITNTSNTGTLENSDLEKIRQLFDYMGYIDETNIQTFYRQRYIFKLSTTDSRYGLTVNVWSNIYSIGTSNFYNLNIYFETYYKSYCCLSIRLGNGDYSIKVF